MPEQVDGIALVVKAGEEEFNLTQSALNDAKAAGTTAVSPGRCYSSQFHYSTGLPVKLAAMMPGMTGSHYHV